jgi:hypothetical protein
MFFKKQILPGITLTEEWDVPAPLTHYCEVIGCIVSSPTMGKLPVGGRYRYTCVLHMRDLRARYVR